MFPSPDGDGDTRVTPDGDGIEDTHGRVPRVIRFRAVPRSMDVDRLTHVLKVAGLWAAISACFAVAIYADDGRPIRVPVKEVKTVEEDDRGN